MATRPLNYDPAVTYSNNALCDFAEDGYDCDGNCLNDADGDGVCDEFELAGCQDGTHATSMKMQRILTIRATSAATAVPFLHRATTTQRQP